MLGYKAAKNGETRVLVTLEIPEDALTNICRTNIVNRDTAKYRTNKAKVISIEDSDGKKYTSAITGFYDNKSLTYNVGEEVVSDEYDKDIENVCSSGIHFCLNKHVAELYGLDKIENGLYQQWYDNNGRKYKECTYKDGKREGLYQKWYIDGEKLLECIYKDDKLEGLYQEWYKNGQKLIECTYTDGRLEGLYQTWHYNSQIYEECTYKNNKKEGLSQLWHDDGEKSLDYTYKDGVKV